MGEWLAALRRAFLQKEIQTKYTSAGSLLARSASVGASGGGAGAGGAVVSWMISLRTRICARNGVARLAEESEE